MQLLIYLTLISAIFALINLLALHFTSTEFKPSWRMISEYALGKYKILITLFFISWGVSSLLLSVVLYNSVSSTSAIVGVILLAVSGIGEIMGGLFDVKHKLHGLAFLLGIPALPIAALLVSYDLIQFPVWENHSVFLLSIAHGTWISVVLMAFTMMVLFSGFKKAGIPMGKDIEPPAVLPKGVIALNGYANRLLVVVYIGWIILLSSIYLTLT